MSMPVLELTNWLHQTTTFYACAIPLYIYLNNFAGPRVLEPVFCHDYLMAHFDKIATGSSSSTASTAAAAPKTFTPTPGKVPKLPSTLFRGVGGGVRGRFIGLAASTAMKAFK
jgi:hypothetical protein